MTIIGIVGLKSSGKSTCAEYMVRNYNYHEFAFANPLKKICKILFSLTDSDVHRNKEQINPNWGITNREILQKFGTDVCRDLLPKVFPQITKSVWITIMEKNIKEYEDIIISDVRYPDEAKFIKDNNGIILEIVRPELKNDDLHQSETQKIESDFKITNDSSIINFYQQISNFLTNNLFFNCKCNNFIEILHNQIKFSYSCIDIITSYLHKDDLINFNIIEIIKKNFNTNNNIYINDNYKFNSKDTLINNIIKRFSVNEIYELQTNIIKSFKSDFTPKFNDFSTKSNFSDYRNVFS